MSGVVGSVPMQALRLICMVLAACASLSAGAAELDQFDGIEQLQVGRSRVFIANFGTFQCGWRLVFDRDTAVAARGIITFSVKTIPAEKGECGCKARTNDFHLMRSRSGSRIGKDGLYIPDILVAKGRIGPAGSRTFAVAEIYRAGRKVDYYINFDCTD